MQKAVQTESLQELLEQSIEGYVAQTAKEFLEGDQSFRWMTRVMLHSGLSKEATVGLLLPLSDHRNSFRREALFHWLEKAEW
jgi:hypothetical protein